MHKVLKCLFYLQPNSQVSISKEDIRNISVTLTTGDAEKAAKTIMGTGPIKHHIHKFILEELNTQCKDLCKTKPKDGKPSILLATGKPYTKLVNFCSDNERYDDPA